MCRRSLVANRTPTWRYGSTPRCSRWVCSAHKIAVRQFSFCKSQLVFCRSYAGMGNAGTGGQMVTPPDETTADPYAVIEALRQQLAERSAERDAALNEKAALAEALAKRNNE